MKGVILAGGTGSRLSTLTKVVNKHLLPVGKYPMLYHGIYKLREAGIMEVCIVTGKEDVGAIGKMLGSGEELGMNFTYRIQEQAGGISQALGLAKDFVGEERCVVLLGDNIFEDNISEYVKRYEQQKEGAKILIKEVHDPERYGVPQLEGNKIIGIKEKPEHPKSKYCVTGIYMYDSNVFDIIKNLSPSNRGELEITDVNVEYIKRDQLTYDILQGWWIDAGTMESFKKANELAWDIIIE